MIIVIVGPDGSGKTTVANGLVDTFRKENVSVNHIAMHFHVLPPLKRFINPFLKKKIDNSHQEGEFHAGMKSNPNSSIKGMIYVFWYALDYCLGRFRLRKSRTNKEITVFARYYFDYYYQRGHVNTPIFFIRLMELFVPKPTLIFTIERPASDIFMQKPELSVKEIKRQQNRISQFILCKDRSYKIDGKQGVEDTIKEVHKIIKQNFEF